MRVHISHASEFEFAPPASGIIKTLHLTPRNHNGQDVIDWRIDVSETCRLDRREDAFGNIVHTFSPEGPLSTLSVVAEGDVDVFDTSGIVRQAIERFPPQLFLRSTSLTETNVDMAALVDAVRAYEGSDDPLTVLHGINRRICETVTCTDDPASVESSAATLLKARSGTYHDFPHLFIAMGRVIGIPCRYVTGYFGRVAQDRIAPAQSRAHAWAEAHVPDLGWVAFDPVHAGAEDGFHVRLAAGLDFLGVAPVRGASFGEGVESLTVAVKIGQALQQARQVQS